MNRFQNILVATDTRYDDHQVVNEAATIAKQTGAKVTIVDSLPDFSLVAKLSMPDHNQVAELIVEEKQKKLDELAKQLSNDGITVDTTVLRGQSSIEIIRFVLREGIDLVMRTTKAKTSREAGFFGRSAKRLLRKCPCPIWLMRPGGSIDYKRILACVDASSDDQTDDEINKTVCEIAAEVGAYHGAKYSIAHAWEIWNSGMMKSRMAPTEYEKLHKDMEHQAERLFGKLLARHGAKLDDDNIHLLEGETSVAITRLATELETDLIVLGTVARSGLQGVLMGNTAERILNRVECDVLAVKPIGFQCPIKFDFKG